MQSDFSIRPVGELPREQTPEPRTSQTIEKRTCDVVIIGGGLAGLTAADDLTLKGYDVIVIEALSQVGGRVATKRPFPGVHFESGALSFGKEEKILRKYVESLPVIKHSSIEQQVIYRNQKGRTKDFLELADKFIPKLKNLIEGNEEDFSVEEALRKVGASEETIAYMQYIDIGGLLGDGFENLSLRAFLSFLNQYDECTEFYAIEGGNDRLPAAIASRLGGKILFDCEVLKIDRTGQKCLTYASNLIIESKKAIITVPLPAMKKIIMEPSLSPKKQEAIRNVRYTACARTSIVAPRTILDEPARGGTFLVSDRGWFRDQTAFQTNPQKNHVFSVSIAGKSARNLLKFIEEEDWHEEIKEIILNEYPNINLEQAEFHTQVWPEGGYSSFSPGKWHEIEELQRREGNLHCAGEHTAKNFASMNGAMASGLRAADEIDRLLSSRDLK